MSRRTIGSIRHRTTAGDTVPGFLETATQAEQETGTAVDKIVTPGRQHFHVSAAKAWLVYDPVTPATLASYNITSVSDAGTGNVDVTINVNMSGGDYVAIGTALDETAATRIVQSNSTGTGTVDFVIANEAGTVQDPDELHCVLFGDL